MPGAPGRRTRSGTARHGESHAHKRTHVRTYVRRVPPPSPVRRVFRRKICLALPDRNQTCSGPDIVTHSKVPSKVRPSSGFPDNSHSNSFAPYSASSRTPSPEIADSVARKPRKGFRCIRLLASGWRTPIPSSPIRHIRLIVMCISTPDFRAIFS